MTDPLNDPRFPDRPSHPDFWRAIDAVNWLDAQEKEGGRTISQTLDGIIDVKSVTYLAQQRALSTRMMAGLPDQPVLTIAMAALWMDAFAAGVRYQQEGGHRHQPEDNA